MTDLTQADRSLMMADLTHQSAYGAGAPSYENVDLQRHLIEGRLKVAQGIAARAANSGDQRRAVRWKHIADELLDRLLEVRGR